MRQQPRGPTPREGVDVLTGVVHASLNDVVQGEATGCLLVAQASVHLGREHLGHVIVVLAQVGVLLLRGVVHLQLIMGVSERHDDVGLLAYRTITNQDQRLSLVQSEESLAAMSY